jgi:hypothetical protein
MAIDKDKMKCNVPRREVQGGKKFVVKATIRGCEYDNQEKSPSS